MKSFNDIVTFIVHADHSAEITPRASMQLDSDQLRSALSDLQKQQEKSQTRRQSSQPSPSETSKDINQKPAQSTISSKGSRRSLASKRSAFESRPKIPRTPEATSPNCKKSPTCQSPDSTVSSTQPSRTSERDEDQNVSKSSRLASGLNDRSNSGLENSERPKKDGNDEEDDTSELVYHSSVFVSVYRNL